MNDFKKELDFLPATAKLEEVLFNVAEVEMITKSKKSLFTDNTLDGIPVSGYKALINTDNKEVLSVVSSSYKLILNQKALELGRTAFTKLFPSVNAKDLIVFKVISSKRKTFCHIDLIHKGVSFNAWQQETWFPFLRITNSYNRMFALSFELGFVRKLCSNGVIFDKKTVKVKFTHTQSDIPAGVDVNVDVSKLKSLENEFITHLHNLKRFYIPKDKVFPMLCKALNLNYNFDDPDKTFGKSEYEKFINLRDTSTSLTKEYFDKNGENAFAAFNVITDIVSHQDHYQNLPNYSIRSNGYYQKISSWMRDYTDEAEKRDFKLDNYLSDYLKYNSLN